jgi:hypothetical protein
MTAKTLESCQDKVGQEVRVGSWVVAPYTASILRIGQVARISPKMLTIDYLSGSEGRKFHNEVICMDQMSDHLGNYLVLQKLKAKNK